MEVLLASSILLASLVVLGQMATIGRQQAEDAESLTTAQLLCLAKLNELTLNSTSLQSQEATPLETAPGWMYEVQVQPQPSFGLVALRVIVSPEEDAEAFGRKGKSFSLVRWLHQPQVLEALQSGVSPMDGGESAGWDAAGGESATWDAADWELPLDGAGSGGLR